MSNELTSKQARALPLLVLGETAVAVAKQVGVKASTISQWVNHDLRLQEALDGERQHALQQAREALIGGRY